MLAAGASVLLLAGCGGAAKDRFASAPLQNLGAQSYGSPLGGGPIGMNVDYEAGAHVGLDLHLDNRSHSRLTLLSARVTDHGARLIRQIDARLDLVYEVCGGFGPCRRRPGYLSHRYGSEIGPTLLLLPGQWASVQLDFLVSGCGTVPPGPKTYAQTLDVAYRENGKLRHQLIPTGDSQLRIYAPDTVYCRQTKHSGLAVMERDLMTGSAASAPVGHGDDCTLKNGVLTFESQPMPARGTASHPGSLRVRFAIKGYRGPRSYRVDGPQKARRPVTLTTVGPNGARAAYMGHILVVGATGTMLHGRLQAEFSPNWPRNEDRVWGGWWCLVAS